MSEAEAEARRVRALLDERSASLARRGRAGRQGSGQESGGSGARRGFLVCALGTERYGLPVAAVAGVLPERPCTPLPGAPAALRGIVAHAGAVISVIDLGGALGLDRGGEAGSGHLVRLKGQEAPIALAVERVLGLAEVAAEAVAAPPEGGGLGTGAISGYAPGLDGDAGNGFSVIDLPRLLRPFLP